MTFQEVKETLPEYDELTVIGRTCCQNGRLCHIAGMTRNGSEGSLYAISFAPELREEGPSGKKNRDLMKNNTDYGCFDGAGSFRTKDREMEVEGMDAACLALNDRDRTLIFFAELMKAGWEPPVDGGFADADWEKLLLTTIRFSFPGKRLPKWHGEIAVRYQKSYRQYFIEKPLTLEAGQEKETSFSLEDGRTGVCYINKVYPIDVWKEQEEQFKDPRYLEHMTEEELADMKQMFYRSLEQSCPRGMCYLGIEYECSMDGNLIFYDRKFLDAAPEEHSGSAMLMMMSLKPDIPEGTHGLKRRGCVIQTPVPADIRQMEAEVFAFVEGIPEREETLVWQ